jgi:hypothetical protein
MRRGKIRSSWAGFLFVGLLVGSSAFASTEPTNNNVPYNGGTFFSATVAMYSTISTGLVSWSGAESISPSGDVDYLVMTCAGRRNVSQVSITYNQGAGDVDIQAYTLDGTFLGISQGVSGVEIINTSGAAKQAIVLMVYGFNGATNASYNVQVGC